MGSLPYAYKGRYNFYLSYAYVRKVGKRNGSFLPLQVNTMTTMGG
jgi:hypothetical protein